MDAIYALLLYGLGFNVCVFFFPIKILYNLSLIIFFSI